MITSPQNTKIRELVKLKKSAKERAKQGVFLVEGPKMFRELEERLCREVYVSESFARSPEGRQVLERVHAPLIIILENLQDPGNLGTIVRTCEAAGATGIVLSRGCADIYSPKVTRSTMGSIFRVPFVYTDQLEDAIRSLQRGGVRVYAAHLMGSVDLYEKEDALSGPAAILIGNESRGLTRETASLADAALRIPMSGRVESLNAAVAAAVMLYEAKRQRTRNFPPGDF